jgi:hypothetical protein
MVVTIGGALVIQCICTSVAERDYGERGTRGRREENRKEGGSKNV